MVESIVLSSTLSGMFFCGYSLIAKKIKFTQALLLTLICTVSFTAIKVVEMLVF